MSENRFKFEREGLDFPFYNQNLSALDISALIFGFISVFILIYFQSNISMICKSILMLLLTFIPLIYVSRKNLSLFIKKFRKNDLLLIITFPILYYIVSAIFACILIFSGFPVKSHSLINQSPSVEFWISIFIQIFAEELFKLNMFIAALYLIFKKTSNRKNSVIFAALFTTILFSSAHFYAYGSIIQPLFILGVSNLILIFSYLKTKNILIPFVIHLTVDLIPLLIVMSI